MRTLPDPQALADLVALSARRLRLTCDEYHGMAEALAPYGRTELIDGDVLAVLPIGAAHVFTIYRTADALQRRISAPDASPARLFTRSPLRLSGTTEPEPDLALLRPDVDMTRIPTAADALLVIEVSDATERFDRAVKLPRYAAAGVPEVWLALPETRTIERYRLPGPDGYAERSRHAAGDEIEALGALLPVDAMFPAQQARS